MKIFGKYAEYYDIFYHDKDYEGECDFLEKIFENYSNHPVKDVLDLGCGTGGHCIPLSFRGYNVVGVDLSEEMLRQARDKARAKDCKIRFECNDLRQVRLNQIFDAVVVLFNVAGYQKENEDMHQMLETVSIHLKTGGILIFDFWFRPSVMAVKPDVRFKEFVSGDLSILRFTDPNLNTQANRVNINYRVLCIKDRTVVANITENHQVRFFFLPEIVEFLGDHGMKMLHFCKWMQLDEHPAEADWNACVVARKL